jgi:hypothetical protein
MKKQATWDELPIEIKDRMLTLQVEQGNPRDENVFKEWITRCKDLGGFDINDTLEGFRFWSDVLLESNFELFFERYEKKAYH